MCRSGTSSGRGSLTTSSGWPTGVSRKAATRPKTTGFCPDQPITRGQMAAFLARALELPAANNVFADTADHPFRHEIARLAAAGITRGCDPPANTRFCPGEPVTRAEMAVFLVRAGLVDVG